MRRSRLVALLIAGCAHSPTSTSPSSGVTHSLAPSPPPLPQDRIAAIVEAANAIDDQGITTAVCTPWIDELVAIHGEHGERYGDALLYAARIARRCGEPGRARAAFELATRAKVPWIRAEGLVGIAVLERDGGELETAEQALRAALQIDPGHDAAALELAHLLVRRHDVAPERARFDEVRQLATTHLERSEGNPRWLAVLARLHLVNARIDETSAREAELTAQILVRLDDARARADAYYVLGMLRLRAGEDTEGLRALRGATHEDPEHAESWANIGLVLVRMRDFDGALDAIAQAQQQPQLAADRDLQRARGSALVSLGHFHRAQLVYERLAKEYPADVACDFDLATLAEAQAHATKDVVTREQFLADAARHYRAYLRGAPATHAAERERAAAFLQSYAVPPASEQQ